MELSRSVVYVGKGQATISRRSVPAIYWDAGVKARNNDKMILPEGEARSTSSQSSLLHSWCCVFIPFALEAGLLVLGFSRSPFEDVFTLDKGFTLWASVRLPAATLVWLSALLCGRCGFFLLGVLRCFGSFFFTLVFVGVFFRAVWSLSNFLFDGSFCCQLSVNPPLSLLDSLLLSCLLVDFVGMEKQKDTSSTARKLSSKSGGGVGALTGGRVFLKFQKQAWEILFVGLDNELKCNCYLNFGLSPSWKRFNRIKTTKVQNGVARWKVPTVVKVTRMHHV